MCVVIIKFNGDVITLVSHWLDPYIYACQATCRTPYTDTNLPLIFPVKLRGVANNDLFTFSLPLLCQSSDESFLLLKTKYRSARDHKRKKG